jgi:hypothetical protein
MGNPALKTQLLDFALCLPQRLVAGLANTRCTDVLVTDAKIWLIHSRRYEAQTAFRIDQNNLSYKESMTAIKESIWELLLSLLPVRDNCDEPLKTRLQWIQLLLRELELTYRGGDEHESAMSIKFIRNVLGHQLKTAAAEVREEDAPRATCWHVYCVSMNHLIFMHTES